MKYILWIAFFWFLFSGFLPGKPNDRKTDSTLNEGVERKYDPEYEEYVKNRQKWYQASMTSAQTWCAILTFVPLTYFVVYLRKKEGLLWLGYLVI